MGAVFQALEGLRRQACSMMFRENAAAGDVLWSDGDTDAETFHILLRGGPIREVKEGETVRTLRMGDVSRHDIAGIWVAFFQEPDCHSRSEKSERPTVRTGECDHR